LKSAPHSEGEVALLDIKANGTLKWILAIITVLVLFATIVTSFVKLQAETSYVKVEVKKLNSCKIDKMIVELQLENLVEDIKEIKQDLKSVKTKVDKL